MNEPYAPPALDRRHRAALDAAVRSFGKPTIPVSDELIDLARQALWLLNHGAPFKKELK